MANSNTLAPSEQRVTEADLERFCQDCLARWEAYRVKSGYTADVHAQEYVFQAGPKFARIVVRRTGDERSGSAFAFIALSNGDILKPASWKTPAKHARGNIFSPDRGASGMGPYGPAYLR